jgi:hypothetical protein
VLHLLAEACEQRVAASGVTTILLHGLDYSKEIAEHERAVLDASLFF